MKGTALIYDPTHKNGPKEVHELDAPAKLELLQGAVGGHIEAVPGWNTVEHDGLTRECVAFCNEEGKLMSLPLNVQATFLWHRALPPPGLMKPDGSTADVLVGTIIVLYGDAEFMDEI